MTVKEVFSKLYSHSQIKEDQTWKYSFNVKNDAITKSIEGLFQNEIMLLFENINYSEKIIPIIHEHFDQIIEHKNTSQSIEEKEFFRYMQLVWGLQTSSQLNVDGEFEYCYDIFMKSVLDKVYNDGESYLNSDIYVYNIMHSKSDYIANSYSTIEKWYSELYYYSKSYSGLNEWCKLYFDDIYYELNENLQIESHHPQFLSNLFSWCERAQIKNGGRAIRTIIDREYKSINWSDGDNACEIKTKLGLQLLLCQNHKDSDQSELYNELKEHSQLNPLMDMQALFALCSKCENLERYYEQLKKSIKGFNRLINLHYRNTFNITYQRARIFKNLLNSCIISAAELERGDIIDDLLISYYDIDNSDSARNIIYIIPNLMNRVTFCLPSKTVIDEKNAQDILIKIVNIENKAFNINRLLVGGFNTEIIHRGHPIGLPDPKYAVEYENKLLQLYNFELIKDELKNIDSLIQFDFNQFPIQALMLKTINNTLPINLSLSKKNEFPKVKSVMFWSGNSQTTEIEEVALTEIFLSKEIEFEVHNEKISSLKQFVERINEIAPDIVWISSHGEFQYNEPNSSKIHLMETDSIDIRDFTLLVNNGPQRRLLFLNVCESGAHSQSGEYKNLGFPNLLASENQDIISHLWLADSRFAYVFGTFIAVGIAHLEKDFFEAFKYSMSIVLDSKETILNELDRFPLELTDLKERIQNNDGTEWGNIITTGSPVYNL